MVGRHNTFTFLAIAFERYIVAATREAMPRIADPANAMMSQYPGLHLASVANLEATFTPLFKMGFDNRRPLFEGGDERVGTLLLWHFVEEIEHRKSALLIHHHVTGIYNLVLSGFEKHVPLKDRHVPASSVAPRGLWLEELSGRLPIGRRRGSRPSMLSHVPGRTVPHVGRRMARGVRLRRRRYHLRRHAAMNASAARRDEVVVVTGAGGIGEVVARRLGPSRVLIRGLAPANPFAVA